MPITMTTTSLDNPIMPPPTGLLGPLYPEQEETKLDEFVKMKMKFSAQNYLYENIGITKIIRNLVCMIT